MKYNILHIIYIISILLAASACEKAAFLDQKPYSQTSPENFYRTESDLRSALVSCYEVINGHKIPGASYVQRGSYGQGLLYVMNGPADDIIAATSSSDEGLEMYWGNYIESTKCIRDMWKVMYCGISRCNTLLHYIDYPQMSDEAKVRYMAEARFCRAFFYYHLAWCFGGVPIVTEYDSSGEEPRSSLEQVYGLILDDLEYAYANLGDEGILQTSSANRYTAAAYIARICNYLAACGRNKVGADLVAEQPLNDFSFVEGAGKSGKTLEQELWERSRDVCKDIIENSKYVLISDYTNLFRETTKEEQYRECLLLAEQPLSGTEGYWPNSYYLPTPVNSGTDSPIAYGGRHVPTPRAFYMYHPQDPRRDHNLTGRLTDGKEEVIVGGYTYWKPVKQTTIIVEGASVLHPLYDSPTQTYLPVSGMQLCPGKYRLCNFSEVQHSYQQHAVSIPLMRLADVYLLYAEALYWTGNESAAREQLDIVLRRSVKDDALFAQVKAAYHRDDFIEELLESRERELIFECSRKFDLIRYNQINEKIASLDETMVVEKSGEIDEKYLKYQTDGYLYMSIPVLKRNWNTDIYNNSSKTSHKIWLPISEEQIGVNKTLTQNAGWGASPRQ
ncbi:MAG: RagB/SusD family nutrient uptake outer membrane protein [Candidatus Cryptobacteroides sp.]